MITTSPTILVVEDGQSERNSLVRALQIEHYEVLAAKDPDQALSLVEQPIDLVISDLRMGKRSGIDLLREWRQRRGATPFIIMTAYGDVDSAVSAMKLGAADFVTKPVNPDQLLALVSECLKSRMPAAATANEQADGQEFFNRIVGKSQGMLDVSDQTNRVARTESTVLVLGESGTGKELIAEAIHHNSPRRNGPFILVNMAAIPETLVESELFGHLKGAFTGASNHRVGRFEAAQSGTIFIDEIGDFPLGLQAKLLRVLENRTITPVGSNHDRPVDVRVVAATSRNLDRMTREGQFREDLFYRLNVVVIHLPPLRQRREDIPLLADSFVSMLSRVAGKTPLVIEPDLMRALESFDWPGNVRQLRNCLESMVVMARGDTLTVEDLPRSLSRDGGGDSVRDDTATPAAGTLLEEMKRTAIMRALAQFHGNRTRTAEHLGISVRTLQRKLKEWGLPETAEPSASPWPDTPRSHFDG